MAAQSNFHSIHGSERPGNKRSRLLGPLETTEPVSVTFVLRSRPGGSPLPDIKYWRKTPPGKRTFLSPSEFLEKYGASEADIDAVRCFAISQGCSDLAGRVQSFGGDPSQIPASETGQVPGLTKMSHHHPHCNETKGKIRGIVFDHFGDFEGFIVEDECGRFTASQAMSAPCSQSFKERGRSGSW